jgi:putative endonuclease
VRTYYVYILSSHSRCIYIGVTNDLVRRVIEHRTGKLAGFTKKYHVTQLVYFEQYRDVISAITREKQLKRWPRARKDRLIEKGNPMWLDLGGAWRLDA